MVACLCTFPSRAGLRARSALSLCSALHIALRLGVSSYDNVSDSSVVTPNHDYCIMIVCQ